MTLNEIRDKVHQTAITKGWWEDEQDIGTLLMLVVTECAEAMEAVRDGHSLNVGTKDLFGKPLGFPSELADIIIRVLNICGRYDIDIEKELLEKMNYNDTREYKHGGKLM